MPLWVLLYAARYCSAAAKFAGSLSWEVVGADAVAVGERLLAGAPCGFMSLLSTAAVAARSGSSLGGAGLRSQQGGGRARIEAGARHMPLYGRVGRGTAKFSSHMCHCPLGISGRDARQPRSTAMTAHLKAIASSARPQAIRRAPGPRRIGESREPRWMGFWAR